MTSTNTRRARVDAVLAELRERFPAAFPTDPAAVRPLALRVRLEREPGAVDRALLGLRDDPAGGLLPVLARALDGAARSRT